MHHQRRARTRRFSSNLLSRAVHATYQRYNTNTLKHAPRKWNWKWRRNIDNFTMFTHRDIRHRSLKTHYVLMHGIIHNCSVKELKYTLQSPDDLSLNALLHGMFGEQFIHGFVLQRETIQLTKNGDENKVAKCQLYVRSCAFSKAHLFAQKEQWNFLDFVCDETFDEANTQTGFVHCVRTIDSEEAYSAEKPCKSTNKLRQREGVHAAYLVRNVANDCRAVRLQFFGECSIQSSKWMRSSSSSHHVKMYLKQMAEGVTRLGEIIRRRRLGFQIYADISAFGATNRSCVCCTRRLSLNPKGRKRCNLCGNAICEGCSLIDNVRKNGAFFSMRVCERCIELVDDGDYDDLEGIDSLQPTIQQDSVQRENVMSSLLSTMLQDTNEEKRNGLVVLFKSMMIVKHGELEAQDATLLDELTIKSLHPSDRLKTVVEEKLSIDNLSIDQCVFAQMNGRKYAINHSDQDRGKSVPLHSIPLNENQRIEILEQKNLLENSANSEDLQLLCELAALEMGCESSCITLIDSKDVHVVASNLAELRNLSIPREQAFCSHVLMDEGFKPLLIAHSKCDVRFRHYDAVTSGFVDFYFGFPIVSDEGVVLGTLCCADSKKLPVSTEQYSVMRNLAITASGIISMQAKSCLLP
uniref:Uncharacterized protein AlNc14C66G4674 n=1 Tax=Albugo laibachii Nc14 TaxID=890382 RepID=F0WDF4_9STRA|nr:conserved hypothetical protein [Albugo laibachii Nc14]|eukprot:CCA19226.1 conserved hypothetical protein [Albugo laibachii Nc14]